MAPYRVCFGCVTDDKPRYQRQAAVLLASLRRLGGEYGNTDFFVCTTGAIAPEIAPFLTMLGARVVHVPPVSTRLPATGKLRFLELPDIAGHDYAVLMDCDTAIAMPPDGLFGGAGVRARMAGATSVPPAVLADLFARAGLPPQDACYWTTVKRERTPIYVNSGVVVVAAAAARDFAHRWARHQSWLLDHPELLPGCAKHTNQASLAVALVDSGIAFEALDIGFNFPVHRAPPAFYTSEIDALAPTILHYDLTDEDGSLRPSPGAAADAAITRVNRAWRSTRASLASLVDIAGRS
jgi:hypothetical protein